MATKGRPSNFTKEIADEICERIANGETVRQICSADEMPCMSSVFNWLRINEDFVQQYARAKEAQMEALGEDLLDIADDGTNDWMTRKFGDTEVEVVNNEAIQRSKLRVDTRKWLMSKLQPKKYGDKVQNEHSGPNGGAIPVSLEIDL